MAELKINARTCRHIGELMYAGRWRKPQGKGILDPTTAFN